MFNLLDAGFTELGGVPHPEDPFLQTGFAAKIGD
jgi:hypothetical protein